MPLQLTSPSGSFGPGFTFSLDLPKRDEEINREMFVVAGWALHRPQPLDRIEVRVDGRSVGRARLGIYRSDLAMTFGDPSVAICGFELIVDGSEFEVHDGSLELELFGSAGDTSPERLFRGSFRVAQARTSRTGQEAAPVGGVLSPGQAGAHAGSRVSPGQLDLVVFTHDLEFGGAQMWLQELLSRTGAGRRFPCTVVAFGDGPLRRSLSELGVAVRIEARPAIVDWKAYEQGVLDLAESLVVTDRSCALVNTIVSFPGADASIRRGMPVIWGIHESRKPRAFFVSTHHVDPDPDVLAACDRALMESRALVFECEATRRMYETRAGPGRSVVVPYGVDTDLVDQYAAHTTVADARTKVGVDSQTKVALMMGAIEPRKSQTVAVDAFTRVARDHPEWTLVMVGDRDTPYSRAVKDYASASGLVERIRVLPVTDDPFLWYRASDVLLSASDLESLPRSMLESMCFGVPPVASSVFGVPELIQDGRNGFLFEPNDTGACAKSLRRVFNLEPCRLAEVGAAARSHVLASYDSRVYSAGMLQLLKAYAARDPRTARQLLSDPVGLRRHAPI